MVEGFKEDVSTFNLIALHIQQLEKCKEDLAKAADILKRARLQSKHQFEKHFEA